MDDQRSNNGGSPDGMSQEANSDSEYRSADEDADSVPSIPNMFDSDDDGVHPPSAYPSAAMDMLLPSVEFGAPEEKFDAPSGSFHMDAAAKDVPDDSPDGSDSSSTTRSRSSSKRSRSQKLLKASQRTRVRTAKHDKCDIKAGRHALSQRPSQ